MGSTSLIIAIINWYWIKMIVWRNYKVSLTWWEYSMTTVRQLATMTRSCCVVNRRWLVSTRCILFLIPPFINCVFECLLGKCIHVVNKQLQTKYSLHVNNPFIVSQLCLFLPCSCAHTGFLLVNTSPIYLNIRWWRASSCSTCINQLLYQISATFCSCISVIKPLLK